MWVDNLLQSLELCFRQFDAMFVIM